MDTTPSDDVAFRTLFDAHHADVQAYCFRRLRSEDANDATAEVFLVAWRRIATAPPGDSARLWLFGIARNVVRNQQRSARRLQRLRGRIGSLSHHPEPDPAAQLVRTEEHRELIDQLNRIPEADRELLRLRNWEELSASEISDVTGLTVRAVETRLSRARKKLADRVRSPSLACPLPVEEGGER